MLLSKRIASIDFARGVVMIIMALDHVRDLLHETALTQSPTDLNTTTPFLFFTRWITHLCAPTFVFLSGASAWLSLQRSADKKAGWNFLWKRGLWLILLEFTLINFGLWFDIQFRILMLQVIAAIGVGLLSIAALAKVKPLTIGIIALLIIFLHNLLQYVPPASHPFLNVLMNIFFRPGLQQVSPEFIFFIAYPIIPWIAIMLLGFSLGKIFEHPVEYQKKIFLRAGISCLLLFILLRFVNIYGDPALWTSQKNVLFTFLSFINATKYPPSLLFILLFLGITFLLLCFADKFPTALHRIISVYGKVPLFYYLLHIYLIRIAVFVMVFIQGYKWSDLQFGPFQFGRPASGSGISLGWIYVVWLMIVIILYPLCKWFSEYKVRNHAKPWLRYL